MREQLYPHQEVAIRQIQAGGEIYLAHDPGLGKSRTALEAAKRRDVNRLLVICPASGRYVWQKEAKLWSSYRVTVVRSIQDLVGPGIKIVTYGLISQNDSPYVKVITKGLPFDMTVLDEAAALKNPGSNRTKAILGKMLPKLGYVLPMSGTPAPNHAGELYPILKAIYPIALKDNNGVVMDRYSFEDRYCKVVQKRFGMGQPIRVIEGSRNLDDLRKRLAGFMMRVKKEDVLKDLPPVGFYAEPLAVEAPLTTLPEAMEMNDEEFLAYLNGVGEEHIMRLRRVLGLSKVPAAVDYLSDFLEGLPHRKKVLVFAHHKEVIGKLTTGLLEYSPVVITGETTAAAREAAVNTFLNNPKCRVFIGNIQASGTGLTLVGPNCDCSDVFFVEASFSVGDNVQAAARVHRIGQREAVVARFLTAYGTIDERINAILARKARDFENLFG